MPYIRREDRAAPRRRPYSSDLTDAEWLLVEPLLPALD